MFGFQQIMDEAHDGGRALVFMQPETGVFLGLHAPDHIQLELCAPPAA